MTIQDIPDQIHVNDLFENVFLQKKFVLQSDAKIQIANCTATISPTCTLHRRPSAGRSGSRRRMSPCHLQRRAWHGADG